MLVTIVIFFFFKQKTAYEMRISDWSSDVCSSDLGRLCRPIKQEAIKTRGTSMSRNATGLSVGFEDIWLVDGVRTPFADYMGALAEISPIDLGIKVAREVLKKADVPAEDIGTVVAGHKIGREAWRERG